MGESVNVFGRMKDTVVQHCPARVKSVALGAAIILWQLSDRLPPPELVHTAHGSHAASVWRPPGTSPFGLTDSVTGVMGSSDEPWGVRKANLR